MLILSRVDFNCFFSIILINTTYKNEHMNTSVRTKFLNNNKYGLEWLKQNISTKDIKAIPVNTIWYFDIDLTCFCMMNCAFK